MSYSIKVKFIYGESQSLEFDALAYEFEFLGKNLPSMTISAGEPLVPIKEHFSISKDFCPCTVALSTMCARGVVTPKVEVVASFETGDVMTYIMHDVRVYSHSVEGVTLEVRQIPWECMKLSFSKIEWVLENDEKVFSGSNSMDARGDRGLPF